MLPRGEVGNVVRGPVEYYSRSRQVQNSSRGGGKGNALRDFRIRERSGYSVLHRS